MVCKQKSNLQMVCKQKWIYRWFVNRNQFTDSL